MNIRDPFQPHRSLASIAAETIAKNIAGVDPNSPPELEEARRLCREGNPFPLIGLQWPEFLIREEDNESQFFEGEVGNVWNPCLRFDWWQRLIFRAFFDVTFPEIFIKGCTGPGKGACVAIAVNLDFDVRQDNCMWYITADTNAHATQVMFGEIAKWRNRMQWPSNGRNLATTIADHERRFISVLNPEKSSDGESFSGRHGAKYVFDESSAVPDIFYENACKNASRIVCISNPRTKFGFFRSGFKTLQNENKTGITIGTLGKRLCVTIGGEDCLNVKHKRIKDPKSPIDGIEIDGEFFPEGEAIPESKFEKVRALIPGQMDINQFRSILRNANEKWKLQCFAHGMFPDEDPVAQFIMSSWLERHHRMHEENELDISIDAFGLDVARSLDGDDTTLAVGGRNGCRRIFKFKLPTYPEITERVIKIALDFGVDLTHGTHPIAIDFGGGYGAGVGDWLDTNGVWVVEHHPGSRAQVIPEVYMNQRTEDWALLAERIDPTKEWKDREWAIPRETKLVEELLAMSKQWDRKMERFSALPKEQMKAAFHDRRSPDSGDSLMLLWRAVRELDGLDEYLRSLVLSRDVVYSYAGQANVAGKAGSSSMRSAKEVVEDLASYYKRRIPKTDVFDGDDD